MYPGKFFRGRRAVRSAAVAFALGAGIDHHILAANETFWLNPATSGTWNTSTNWTAGTPQAGWYGDIYRGVNVNFNLSSATTIDFGAVQLAGGTAAVPAELTLNTANGIPFFQSANLLLGGSYTMGTQGAGPGEVAASAGTITIDPGGLLAVDPTSTFILSGSGTVKANNEQLFGTFNQSGASNNNLSFGSTVTNCGIYIISGGINSADIIYNSTFFNTSNSVTYTGVYNQSAGTLQGSTGANVSFNNSSAYLFSGGTFIGTMTNNLGATINITSATIPFTQGLVNNGRTTVTNGTGTYAAPISGAGTLVFNGTTSITLTGTNTFTGQTTVSAGTVILAGPSPTNGSGGSLNGNIGISTAGILQTNADSQIANTALVTINGGTLNLGGHDESIGTLNMTAGQVAQTIGPGLGITTGDLFIKGSATISGGLRSNAPFTFNISSSGLLSVGGNIGGYNGNSGTLYLTGGGGLTISANSNLSSIDVNQGMLQISEGGTFINSNTSVVVEAAGTLNIANQSVLITNLTGSGTVGLGTGVLTINTAGDTYAGNFTGNGTLNKTGSGILTLTGSDSSNGVTNVSTGILTVAGSIAGTSINVAAGTTANLNGTVNNTPNINANGTVNFGVNPNSGILVRNIAALTVGSNTVAGNGQVNVLPATLHTNRNLLVTSGVTLAGGIGAWTSQLDLSNNDLVIHNGSLTNVTDQVKSGFANGNWNGNGIRSSAAAADANHLTALGAILNDDGTGTPLYSASSGLGLFDGIAPLATDVLVKFTYYGDANLDGKVDASDYSRIDNSFISETPTAPVSGWYNGDFNYDGVVNGSDYTLIDNAFNNQGSNLSTSAEIAPSAEVTSEIVGTAAVPEPACIGSVLMAAYALGTRRRMKRTNAQL